MTRRNGSVTGRRQRVAWLTLALIAILSSDAFALISGGEGNQPMQNPQWPAGAEAVFNTPARVAWWEGPPFGGGQFHAECRGDANAFNRVLAGFAKVQSKNKQLVVHDGVGASFWLNPNQQAEKKEAAKIDWVFMCWASGNWARAMQFPAGMRPATEGDPADGPPVRLDVYAGGNIDWDDVRVPDGVAVVDKRLAAHGYSVKDGLVLEGNVTGLETEQPIAARMMLERITAQENGGYLYEVDESVDTDANGHWVAKNVPGGWYRVVISADEMVPRILGHLRTDGQPQWLSYNGGLARPTHVVGRVIDGDGKGLKDAEVRLTDVETKDGARYDSPRDFHVKTNESGEFEFLDVPSGNASVRVSKQGYCRIGLSPSISVPADALKMQLVKAAQMVVVVEFGEQERPRGYIVNIEPTDGAGVGKWSGSGQIDGRNQIEFKNVPPGSYVLHGHPNPSSGDQKTKPVTVELVGGETTKIALIAK